MQNFNQLDQPFSSGNVNLGHLMARAYGLLALTLYVSAMAAVFGQSLPFAYEHPILLMLGSFGLLLALRMTGGRGLAAIPLLLAFSGALGLMLGPTLAVDLHAPGGAKIIGAALGLTSVLFVGLSFYGIVSRRNFGHLSGFLFTGLLLAILVSLLNIFLLHIPALQLAIAGVLVLVFSGLIVLDTQRMVHGGVQAPVLLVVSLYLDVLNLFEALLEIFSNR